MYEVRRFGWLSIAQAGRPNRQDEMYMTSLGACACVRMVRLSNTVALRLAIRPFPI